MSDVAPPPPPPPAPAPPPPPPAMSGPPPSSERSALLGSIQGFNSNKLKKVKTNEKKPGDKPLAPSGGGSSSASIGVSSSKPSGGGPSGFGDIFAGGMPKLRSTGNKTTDSSSTSNTTTAASTPAPKPVTSSPVKPAAPSAGVAKPTVTSISKPVIKQSTGVLRPAPVISKAPVVGKVAAKPAPNTSNSAPAKPVQPPAATENNKPSDVPKPTPPVVDPATIKPATSSPPTTSSPKPVMDLPPPIPKPQHESISTPAPAPAPAPTPAPAPAPAPTPAAAPANNEPVNKSVDNSSSGVVSEHTILPGDGTRSVRNNPPAVGGGAPKPTPTINKPAGTPVNWVKPGSGPISPVGKVVQSASVQVAPPRKITSSATPTPLKPAPTVTAKKPAPVSTTTTSSSTTTTTSTSNPTTPTSVSSPKSPAVFNIPPPIAKPSAPKDHHEENKPVSTPAAAPKPTPVAEPPAPAKQHNNTAVPPVNTNNTHTHTHTDHHHHKEEEHVKPAIQHQNSSNNINKTSPRKNDSDELVCARCGGGIEGNHFKALDQAWHIEHFTCVECNTNIQNFVSHENQPYCETCYDRKFVVHKICNMCNKPIYGTVVSAMNSTFHSECFRCSSCSSVFPDNEFYQYEGKPWCAPCIQKLTKAKYEKCDNCHQEIDSNSDGVIKVLGRKYHNNNKCFGCHDCKTPFPNLNYYEIEGEAMCYDCAVKH